MTLNVSLPKELEARVREHVASGMYGSASEVIREALRLFENYQSVQQTQLAGLRADIAKGVTDMQSGKVGPVDMADIRAEGRRLRQIR
jgi:antitoxin ParD1/3/4